MIHTFADKVQIAGIVAAVPGQRVTNSDFLKYFTEKEIHDVAKMTGVEERRRASPDQCSSDLCAAAAEELLAKLEWDRSTIAALIFVSQTGDYILPATACILQHRLGLSSSCVAFDINMGCSGYVYGLYVASKLVNSTSTRRALLLVGDTCTKFISPADKSTAMLFGDAGSATALEYRQDCPSSLKFSLGTDGAGWQNLIIPAGHFRNPANSTTCTRQEGVDGKTRSHEDLYMNGGEIFNFTLSSVPQMVNEHIQHFQIDPDHCRWLVMHQANKFMLEHIRKKLKFPPSSVPYSIGQFGNTSCASIPLTISAAIPASEDECESILAGFGVGYSYAACTTNIENTFRAILEMPCAPS